MKLRRAGFRKVVQKQFVGADQSADGSWVELRTLKDHEVDRYHETVAGPDGVLHDYEGKLSEHVGHGSDKPELREARDEAKRVQAQDRAARKAVRDADWRRNHGG